MSLGTSLSVSVFLQCVRHVFFSVYFGTLDVTCGHGYREWLFSIYYKILNILVSKFPNEARPWLLIN